MVVGRSEKIDVPKRFENINLKGNIMESAENTRNFYEKFLKFKIGTRVYE